ncbi:TPA: hypothetical protein N0F65_006325 [Lagenidium giganteum]|uniref:Transmembrane protein n=1 Tax=Lagenidium giganteum TaxID=4803 RepID=A0AAV2YQW4_9STRA|nr:TPA: hypothetical protein N0F65_006325 [Lagenidium giganteum]
MDNPEHPPSAILAQDDTTALVCQAQQKLRSARTIFFDRQPPLRWTVLFNVFTYGLLCSEVMRSGIGVADLAKYVQFEPNVFKYYGPWFYLVKEARRNETALAPTRVWVYKYDTTSTSWRAFAEHLSIQSFPDCFLYRSTCPDNTNFSTAIWFEFVNEMVETIALKTAQQPPEARAITLRTESFFLDRIHHWILPQLFVNPVWRTNQAMYFSPETLLTKTSQYNQSSQSLVRMVHGQELCFGAAARPFFCDDVWINFRRLCPQRQACRDVGLIWVDTLRRLLALQLRYPDMRIDLTLLSISRRTSDVSTIMRALNGSANTPLNECEPIYVNDYRYEAAIYTTNAIEYYRFVSWLRIAGQSYFYIRMIGLLASCYVTRSSEDRFSERGIIVRLRAVISLFVRIPAYSVVYGSAIPVACYAIAHLIDAPMTYVMIAQQFTTPVGQYEFQLAMFVFLATNQMRNIWLLALVTQVTVQWLLTRMSWMPPRGVLGIPELTLGFLSSLSVILQLRLLTLRYTCITKVQPVNPSSNVVQPIRKFSFDHAGGGNMLLEGVIIDFKFFASLLTIMLMALAAWHLGQAVRQGWWLRYRAYVPRSVLMTRAIVPYTAGTIWPSLTVSVHWSGQLVPTREAHESSFVDDTASVGHEMELIHMRAGSLDAQVALMNLIVMSDPRTFVRLRLYGGSIVHYFMWPSTGKIFALPSAAAVVAAEANLPLDEFVFLKSVNTRDMMWSDLIHIG